MGRSSVSSVFGVRTRQSTDMLLFCGRLIFILQCAPWLMSHTCPFLCLWRLACFCLWCLSPQSLVRRIRETCFCGVLTGESTEMLPFCGLLISTLQCASWLTSRTCPILCLWLVWFCIWFLSPRLLVKRIAETYFCSKGHRWFSVISFTSIWIFNNGTLQNEP